MVKKIAFALALFFLIPAVAFSADLSITEDNVLFSIKKPLAGEVIRIYATVENPSQHDARASVRYFVDGRQISSQPITVLAYKSAVVFTDWAPMEGYYEITVEVVDVDPADADLENNKVAVKEFLVDLDTDGDGKYDTEDWDDDNDGVDDGVEMTNKTNPLDPDTDDDGALDGVDEFPLDPNEKYDSDKDGIGNNADPDNDNDGVLNEDDPEPFNPLVKQKPQPPKQEEPEKEPESPTAPAPGAAPKEPQSGPIRQAGQESDEETKYEIEEVTYTFPDEEDAEYILDVLIAKSRINWRTFQFDILGGAESYMYLWDFSDGKISQEQSPSHKFPGAGTYAVSLSSSDSLGGLGSAQEVIVIGFWDIGNPYVQAIIAVLFLFSLWLAGYLGYHSFLKKKKK